MAKKKYKPRIKTAGKKIVPAKKSGTKLSKKELEKRANLSASKMYKGG